MDTIELVLLALGCVYLIGHLGAETFAPLADHAGLRSLVVMIVMWSMGVTLKSEAIQKKCQSTHCKLASNWL